MISKIIKNSPLSPYFLFFKPHSFFGKKVCLGKCNPGKVFYLISREDENAVGWGSILITTLERLHVASLKHWIPVVDMKYKPNLYLNDEEIGIDDAWLKYFEPLHKGYTIDDAKESKYVIIDQRTETFCPHSRPDFHEKRMWKKLFEKYIRPNQTTSDYMESKWEELFRKEDKIIGVLSRGTDYVALRPKGHPIQPTVDEIIEKTRDTMNQYFCNKVFLATEDEQIFRRFTEAFGEDVVKSVTKDWISYDGNGYLHEYVKNEKDNNQRYVNGLDYITTLFFLSKCKCLVGGRTSAIPIVLSMNHSYEYKYLFDLGVY